VSWNGSTVTGPVLIYHDELLVDIFSAPFGNAIQGALICMSSSGTDTARWHFPDESIVDQARFILDSSGMKNAIQQIPSPQHTRSRLTSRSDNLLLTDARTNGLWTCRGDTGDPIPVGLYRRGGGK
jgi:hypothetical protein